MTRLRLDPRPRPWSSLVMSAETVAAGEPSTRVTEPWTSTGSTSADLAQRCDAHGAGHGHLSQSLDTVDAGIVEAQDGGHDAGRPRACTSRWAGPRARCGCAAPICAVDEADDGGLVGVDRDGDLRRLCDGVAGSTLSRPSSHLELGHDDVAGGLDLAGILAADDDLARPPPAPVNVLLGDGDLEAVLVPTGRGPSLMSSRACRGRRRRPGGR